MFIIGLGCTAQVGKDTAADYVVSKYPDRVRKVSFANKVKDTAKLIFGLSNTQMYGPVSIKEAVDKRYDLTPREIMQGIGEKMREIFPQIWIDTVFNSTIPDLERQGIDIVIITDVRYPNEAEAIHEHGGVVVKVVRDAGGVSVGHSHSSETAMLDYEGFDYFIENNGTREEYFQKIDNILTEVLEKNGRAERRNLDR